MRLKSSDAKHTRSREAGSYDTILVIRLIIAAVIFAVSLIVNKLPNFVSVIMLIISAGIAGYDIVLEAALSALSKDFFSTPFIVVAVTILSYFIGYGAEGAALIILYQIGILLIAYVEERTRKSALELLQYQDESVVNRVSEQIFSDGAGSMNIESVMGSSAGKVLKYAMIFSAVYAVAVPIITNISFRVAFHRALTIVLVATPMSVVISMPLAGIIGMCFSARNGVIFNSAELMEATADTEIAAFDGSGVFCDVNPQLLNLSSDIIDDDTFLTFAAHAVYYSDQPFARAITAVYTKDYKLDLLKNFVDIPGYGVEADIGNAHIVLATRELFVGRGVKLPSQQDEDGQAYFMTVADRYVGKLIIDSKLNEEAFELASGMKDVGVSRCVLLTEDGNAASRELAEELDFGEVYSECDTAKKLRIVSELKSAAKGPVMFIYSSGMESHSDADIDVRINRRGKFADVLISPDYIANLPFAVQICKRVREIVIENAVFAFVIKTILVFLSIIGYCNLWFAMFMDTVAAVATILNTIRVTKESILSSILYRTGIK